MTIRLGRFSTAATSVLLLAVVYTTSPLRASATAEALAACQDATLATAERISRCTRLIEDQSVDAEIRAEAMLNRGLAYAEQDDDENAIHDYSAAIEISPDYAALYFYRGRSYERMEDYDLAIEDLTTLISLTPDDAVAYYERGRLHLLAEYFLEAMADFTKVIEMDPTDAQAYSARGEAYEGLSDAERAIADYRRALELDPDLQDAKDGLERMTAN